MGETGKLSVRVTKQNKSGSISTITIKSESLDDVEDLAADTIRGLYYGSFTIMRNEEESVEGWDDITEYTSYYSG